MKLPPSITATSILILLSTAKFITTPTENLTAASSLSAIPSPIETGNSSQDTSANPSLDIRPLKKPKRGTQIQAREPETCSENSQCFWNHICVDGVCVVGCQDLKDCKPPQRCVQGYCHWKAFKHHGRPRRCSANKQYCLRNYHCCYHRCVLPGRRDFDANTGIFGYCYKVRRGADGPDGDNWGDMRPDSEDIQELLDGGDTVTPARFKRRDVDLEKGDMGLERRDLVAEAREFELDDGGEDLDEEDLDSELIERGKAAYWADH